MKKFLLLLGCLLILVGMAPAFIGRHVEQQYNKILQEVSASYPWLEASTISYEQEWFRSRAVTLIELNTPAEEFLDGTPEVPKRFELIHDVYHGPVILNGKAGPRFALLQAESQLRLPNAARKIAATAFRGREPLTIRTVQTLLGQYQVRVYTPEGTYIDMENGTSFQVKPASGHFIFDPLAATCQGKLEWPGLSAAGEGRGRFRLKGFLYTLDATQNSGPFGVGRSTLGLQEVAFTGADGQELRLDSLKMQTRTRGEQDLLHLAADLGLESISIGGEVYGPGVLTLEARNLDAQSMLTFSTRLRELNAQLQAAASPEARQELAARFGQAWLALLPPLLKQGPQLELTKLRLATPQGAITGRATLIVDTSQPMLLEQVATALLALKAEAQLRVPQGLVAAGPLAERAQGWQTAGLIEEENGYYRFTSRFAMGQLTMNGRLLHYGR